MLADAASPMQHNAIYCLIDMHRPLLVPFLDGTDANDDTNGTDHMGKTLSQVAKATILCLKL